MVIPVPNFFIPVDFLIRCLLSLILGSMIGLEREVKGKPAGLKTHTLIALGSTALTYLSFQFSYQGDPSRIAAQIVSGVGFIGGGAILHSKHIIKGLTTAATLWVASALGMLVGAGFFLQAVFLWAVIFLFLILSKPFSNKDKALETFNMQIEIKSVVAIQEIGELIKRFQLKLHSKSVVRKKKIVLEINYATTSMNHYLFLKRVFRIGGVGDVFKF